MRGALLSGLLPLAAGLAVPSPSSISINETMTIFELSKAEMTPTPTPTLSVISNPPKHSLFPTPPTGSQNVDKGNYQYADTKGKADHFQLLIHPREDGRKHGNADVHTVNEQGTIMVLRQEKDIHHKFKKNQHVWSPTFQSAPEDPANASTAFFNLRRGGLETDDELSSNHKTLHFGMLKSQGKHPLAYTPVFSTQPIGLGKDHIEMEDHWIINRYPEHSQFFELENTKTPGEWAACSAVHGAWISDPSETEFEDVKDGVATTGSHDYTLHYGDAEALKLLPKNHQGIEYCWPVVLVATWNHDLQA